MVKITTSRLRINTKINPVGLFIFEQTETLSGRAFGPGLVWRIVTWRLCYNSLLNKLKWINLNLNERFDRWMNLKYSKMSVFGIIAVYKQEKWISDPLSLDIKEDKVLMMWKQQQQHEDQEHSVNAILKNCKNIEILEMDFQQPSVPLIKNNINLECWHISK